MLIDRIDEAEIETPSTEHKYYLGGYYAKKVQANAIKRYDIYKYVRLRSSGTTIVIRDAITWDTDGGEDYQAKPVDVVDEQEVVGVWEGPLSVVADASVDIFFFIRCGAKTIVKVAGSPTVGSVLVSTATPGTLKEFDEASGNPNQVSNRITALAAQAGGVQSVMLCLM